MKTIEDSVRWGAAGIEDEIGRFEIHSKDITYIQNSSITGSLDLEAMLEKLTEVFGEDAIKKTPVNINKRCAILMSNPKNMEETKYRIIISDDDKM